MKEMISWSISSTESIKQAMSNLETILDNSQVFTLTQSYLKDHWEQCARFLGLSEKDIIAISLRSPNKQFKDVIVTVCQIQTTVTVQEFFTFVRDVLGLPDVYEKIKAAGSQSNHFKVILE